MKESPLLTYVFRQLALVAVRIPEKRHYLNVVTALPKSFCPTALVFRWKFVKIGSAYRARYGSKFGQFLLCLPTFELYMASIIA